MKILLVNNQLKPEVSGAARHFDYLSKNLLTMGHDIERVAAKSQASTKREGKIKYYYFKYIETRAKMSETEWQERAKKNLTSVEKAIAGIKWESIDLIISCNDIYLSALKKHIAPGKIIAIMPSPIAFSEITNPKRYHLTINRMKKNLVEVKTVVLSKKMKALLENFLIGKRYDISVVPPGVNLKKFSRKNNSGNIDLLYVGRMTKEKNIEDLLSALHIVKAPYCLKLVGAGGHLKKIKEIAKKLLPGKKIIFVGKKKYVEKYYAKSKFFVFPTKYEAFGLVILEAMAAGLPVIAFRPSKKFLTASDEIISDGIDGFLVRDIKEMAKKIELLLRNKRLRLKMSENALAKAKKFSWTNHTKKLLELVQ